MTSTATPKSSSAFFAQAAISFGIALLFVIVGIYYLPVGGWIRAFLAVGSLFLVTSSFTLAKVVRDQQEHEQAKMDKLLQDADPFRSLAS